VVADNGPGFPPELIPQVFEPFVTTKEPGKGTGLGLAVCSRIVEVMGGTIQAENAVGGGAVFRVVLPALAPKAVLT
jgi:signal transduction histidine kinase